MRDIKIEKCGKKRRGEDYKKENSYNNILKENENLINMFFNIK